MTSAPDEGKNQEKQSEEIIKKQPGQRKNIFIVCGVFIAIIIIISVAVGTGSKNNGHTSTNGSITPIATPTPMKPDLALLSDEVVSDDDYFSYITGEVKNNTSKELTYAVISFTLYDKSDAEIGTSTDDISNLKAGGIWKYKALVTKEKATQYKFKELTGF